MEIRSFTTNFPGKIIFYITSTKKFECHFIKDFTPLCGFTYRIAGAEEIHKKAIAVNTFLKIFTIISNVVLRVQ